jgi:hypothetical protein
MSVDASSHTTARFPRWSSTGNAAARPNTCPAWAFEVVRSAKTQRQHRSFNPSYRIQYPQSQHPRALTASAARRTAIKSP